MNESIRRVAARHAARVYDLGGFFRRVAREGVAAGARRFSNLFLDGFPRTVNQAEELDRALTERVEGVSAVLCFDAPRQVVIDRIAGRARKEGRADDTPETVKKRLEEYDAQTGPLVPYYRDHGLLHEFDAKGAIDEIYRQVRKVVDGLG
jgi:adenylate kinase